MVSNEAVIMVCSTANIQHLLLDHTLLGCGIISFGIQILYRCFGEACYVNIQ